MIKTSSNCNENQIQIKLRASKEKLNKVLQKYSFYHITEINDLNFSHPLVQNIQESAIIMINQCKEKHGDDEFFIIGFQNSLIIIKQTLISILKPLFSFNQSSTIYFLSNTKDIFKQHVDIQNQQIESDSILQFNVELSNFNSFIKIYQNSGPSIRKINKSISSCITGYLILQSYWKIKPKQIVDFKIEKKERKNQKFNEDDFIILRNIAQGSSVSVELIYEIENGEIYALKNLTNDDNEYLFRRELNNYLSIDYPLLPKIYGEVEEKNSLVIQFINGRTLKYIEQFHFTNEEKYIVIFVLMMIINYFHQNEFIYRDLKPDNVMIDESNNIFIIDFDRMKKKLDEILPQDYTNDFQTVYIAPEVNLGEIKYENDIFSIGQMIYYIINEEDPSSDIQKNAKIDFFNNDQNLLSIYMKCTDLVLDKRPSIFELSFEFYVLFLSKINNSFISNFPEVNYFIGILKKEDKCIVQDVNKYIKLMTYGFNQNNDLSPKCACNLGSLYNNGKYIKKDIQKSIQYWIFAADRNHVDALFNLGVCYYEGIYLQKDIQKSIHYFECAANQNCSDSLFNLGVIYSNGKDIEPNIEKAIHYLKLVSGENEKRAQYTLGNIYYEGKYVMRDINKAIHYLTISADQGYATSKFLLSSIVLEGKYVQKDINKASNYLKNMDNMNFPDININIKNLLSSLNNALYLPNNINKFIQNCTNLANQNDPESQYNLGIIYLNGEYVTQDINKAIFYLELSANQNFMKAILNLGKIYFQGKYVPRDINKFLHYYELASNQNDAFAQYSLGLFYNEGIHIKNDIQKTIYYLSLAANQNHCDSLYHLGLIYYENKYIQRDMNKSIQYFKQAASKNHSNSQYYLGLIYYENKYVRRDLDKSIYYFTQAANQNDKNSLFSLGIIYNEQKNVNKFIHYFTQAAIQNHPSAQHNLGTLFYNNEYVKVDIEKAIYYFSLAANQNHLSSMYQLGIIYSNGKYISPDMDKAVNYLAHAANQNHLESQMELGRIYSTSYIFKNIDKSIYYYSLAADQNYAMAQNNLGYIYCIEKNDINKAIHYFSLAAKNNDPTAQHNLGSMYYFGQYVEQNINKSIRYLTLASKQKYSKSLLLLGYIYYKGEFIVSDMEKSIFYFSLAAKQNEPLAQFLLGLFYYIGYYYERNIPKAIDFFIQSSKKYFYARFIVGFLYHEGKYITKSIDKALQYYKDASNLQDICSKNNIGIIYKYGEGVTKNISSSIEYFNEAIRLKKDKIIMYNLAHIYIFEIQSSEKIDESIKLLIESSMLNFEPSNDLLCIALILKNGFDFDAIEKDCIENAWNICSLIIEKNLLVKVRFNQFYELYKTIDFVYDIQHNPIQTKVLNIKKEEKKELGQQKNITDEFYDGFALNI